MELLKIEKLCKVYGKGENAVTALNDVSFSVPKGQMLAVIGASGSGKSTLLHIIGGKQLKSRYLPQTAGRSYLPVLQPYPRA